MPVPTWLQGFTLLAGRCERCGRIAPATAWLPDYGAVCWPSCPAHQEN
jgi:hypothetical protein